MLRRAPADNAEALAPPNRKRTSAARLALHAALILVVAVWMLPSVGVLITSFRTPADISSYGWWTVLAHPNVTLNNYQAVIDAPGFWRTLANSFIITIPAVIAPILIASLAAYGFACTPFPGRNVLFMIVIALMVVPIQMGFVPALHFFRALSIGSGYGAIWIAHTAYALPFSIFLLRSFFAQLPREILDAASVDGASKLRTYWSIVLPLSRPALASLAVLQFLWVWNDLLMALVFIQKDELEPLTQTTAQLIGTYAQQFNLLSASAVILMIVPLAVFLALQKHFVRGLVAGAVK
jgi:alpha-glucoside transport system permease protein